MPATTLPLLYWGASLEHRFDCAWPLENPLTYPVPRAGAAVAQATDASSEDAAYLGTDYHLEADVRYVPPGALVAPLAAGSTPPNGMDALLTWARQRGKVRLAPDRTTPANVLDGYLIDPWNGPPGLESLDGSGRYHLHFRSATRSYAEALRGLLWEYLPGASLTDPRVYTVTRAQAAYFFDAAGAVVLAGANVLRDRHYPLGPGTARTTLLEPASTNSCLQSQTFNDAGWTKNNTTVSADATTAPDGTATADKLVENTDTNLVHRVDRAVTITSLENIGVSCFVKAAGRTRLRVGASDSTLANKFYADTNLTAGTVSAVSAGGTATGVKIVPLANAWFWVLAWGTLPAGTTARLDIVLQDAGGNPTYSGDGTSGVYLWGAQLERFAGLPSPPTSYMPTVGSTASRASDLVTWPWPYQTQPLWGYAKVLDLGWASQANFNRLLTLSNGADGYPQFTIETGFSTGGTQPGAYRANYNTDFAPQNAAIVTTAVRGYGTLVELFWRWYADGKTEMNVSINGGAVTTATAGGANNPPMLDLITPTLLILGLSANGAALVGVQHLKLGAGTAVSTLAEAAAA